MNFDLSDEQKIWKKTVHDFVAKEVQPKAHEVDVTSEFNWTAARKMGPLGLLGLNIPEEYGGAGVDAVSAAIALAVTEPGAGSDLQGGVVIKAVKDGNEWVIYLAEVLPLRGPSGAGTTPEG